jgi:hypothetical protein
MDDYTQRRGGEAAQRFADRRQRENDAPRLCTEVPRLLALRLEIDERRDGSIVGGDAKHIRRVVVESAPALFVMTCGDLHCKDGGYDVTHAIMRGLHSGSTHFEGEDSCSGTIGSANCSRVLRFTAHATYRE